MRRFDLRDWESGMCPSDDGDYVLFSDHEQALAEAYQRGLDDAACICEQRWFMIDERMSPRFATYEAAKSIRAAKPEVKP